MAVLKIEVSDEVMRSLADLAKRCSQESEPEATTHGSLEPADLLAMLAEDAAMIVSRPGSWEAAGMAQILASHGYEV